MEEPLSLIKGGNDTLSSLRRETMFIQMLEGLHPEEAKIICLVKDKNLTEKYKLTKEIVAEAFPDIASVSYTHLTLPTICSV